jgi:hypothetical protein
VLYKSLRMSDIDLAVKKSKRLEALLTRRWGATGKGLHEKVDSVQSRLPPELVRDIRKVATVRNKIVHDDSYKSIEDRRGFLRAYEQAERGLSGRRLHGLGIVAIAFTLFFIALALYMFHLYVHR